MADAAVVLVPTPVPGPRGPRGVAGQPGPAGAAGPPGSSGSGTIASTAELLKGDGAGAAVASGITPAAVTAHMAANTGDQANIPGNAATVTTIPPLTGDVSNSGNAVTLANVPKTATHEVDPLIVSLNTGGWKIYEVPSNDAYTGQTLQDIAALVSDVLSPGARYEIEAKLLFSVSADVTGMKIAVHGSGSGGAATVMLAGQATGNSAGSLAPFTLSVIDTPTTAFLVFASGTGIAKLDGFVTTRSGGSPTISIQHLKVTSGTVTCLPGSKMRLRKCGA